MLIVDGHNVIHKIDRYRKLHKQEPDLAVEQIVLDLINLAAAKAMDIVAVFDGQASSEKQLDRVKVVYSSADQSADAIIEALVFEMAEKDEDIIVATSDYAQQKVIWRRGARRMTPYELAALMAEAEEETIGTTSASSRNRISENLPKSVYDELEKMRRGRD